MSSETVLCERDGPVAIVTLNRPEKHNAINREMSQAMAETFRELDADDSVLAIVLTGAGSRAFCAGADMSERVADPQQASPGSNTSSGGAGAYGAVANSPKPVIGALNGYTYGGGAALAANCDFRLASSNATVRFVGASYGLVVAGPELSRIVGPSMAKELLYTAKVIDANEAMRIGYVNHVYAPEDLLTEAVAMAKMIAGNSPAAVRWAKQVVDAATIVEKGLEVDSEANRVLRGSQEQTALFKAAAERVTGAR